MNIEPLGTLARTHTCGALRAEDVGKDVVLLGWVHRVRDLGSLVFIDLRDRHGMTQIVARVDEQLIADAKRAALGVRRRASSGTVEHRAPETVNPKIATGEVEVTAREIRLLNEAQDAAVHDRRRDRGHRRDAAEVPLHRSAAAADAAQHDHAPPRDDDDPRSTSTSRASSRSRRRCSTKSTPEGARDYLVPSRVHPGEFYALPQSPQIFKQILMIAGMDRYFQIARCFRDEDLRADRQPEFTQVDLEMSFATEDLVFSTLEPLMERLMALIGRDGAAAVSADALRRGDREVRVRQAGPALRHARSRICRPRLPTSAFSVFRDVDRVGRRGARLCRPGRGEVLAPRARRAGGAGEAARRRRASCGRGARDAGVQSSALKAAGEAAIRARARRWRAPAPADLVVMAAGPHAATSRLLGPAAAADREEGEPARPESVRLPLGRRLSDVRMGRGREALRVHAPSVHGAARERPAPARNRPGPRPRAGLRPRAQRQRDRRRQHPDSRPGAAAARSSSSSASRTRRRSCGSASSWMRSSTGRRRTAALRSGSTASWRSCAASRRSATSLRFRRRPRRSI